MYKPLVWAGSLVLVIFAIFLLVEIDHVSNTATTTNTVAFTGEGKVTATPDIAVISASIVTQAADSKSAQNDNSKKSQAVSDFLKKEGIADKDIKTSGYNIYPQYGSRPCPTSGSGMMYPCVQQQQVSGYQVNQSYEIKVRDLTKVSAILDGLVTAGANQVNNLGLQVENPDTVQAQARQLAIDNAKQKATELEKQVGISLGKIVNFTENQNGGYPVPMYLDAKATGMGSASAPDISPGTNDVTVDVTITYQIK